MKKKITNQQSVPKVTILLLVALLFVGVLLGFYLIGKNPTLVDGFLTISAAALVSWLFV